MTMIAVMVLVGMMLMRMMMMIVMMVMKGMSVSCQVLAEAHPSALGFLWRSYEELYLLLDLLLQSHLLSSRSASFSENFYGLKRVPRAGGGALGRGARGRSLLLLCLLPYLLRRLRRAVSRRRDQGDFSIPPAPRLHRLHRLHRLLACGGGAWAVLRLAQTLLYVAGRARTHSPLLWLAGVRLTPLTARDLSLMRRERPGGPTGSRQDRCRGGGAARPG